MNLNFSTILTKIEAALETALPKTIESQNKWIKDSFGKLPEALTPSYIQNLVEPNKKLIDLGGKRWRPLLLILCYQKVREQYPALALKEDEVYSLTPLVEFVHTASLIHDDIEDSADLRRGEPAAHITYGLDTALNAGAWLYFEAPVCINQNNISDSLKLTLYKTYTMELRKLHLGQAMDIYWHRNPEVFPEIEEYYSMVRNKTGTLARLSALIGCIAGGMSDEEALKIGEIAANIGVGFQIIDDVINLTTGNKGKKRGDDIVEGKKSLPVLIHTQEHPEDKEKISALMTKAAKDGIDSPAIEECISLLESSDCIKTAANKGVELIRENCKKLNSPMISELFTNMIPEAFR